MPSRVISSGFREEAVREGYMVKSESRCSTNLFFPPWRRISSRRIMRHIEAVVPCIALDESLAVR
jgi:hypothetical protein